MLGPTQPFSSRNLIPFFTLRVSGCAFCDTPEDKNVPQQAFNPNHPEKYQAAPRLAIDIGGGPTGKIKYYEEASSLVGCKKENPNSRWQNCGKPQKNSIENPGKDLQIGPMGVLPEGSLTAEAFSPKECSSPLVALIKADKTIHSNRRPTP